MEKIDIPNQEEGDSTLPKTEIVANMNVKILALSRKFEHPSIQTPEVCFLLQPDNYKDQAQAFVSLSTPKAEHDAVVVQLQSAGNKFWSWIL